MSLVNYSRMAEVLKRLVMQAGDRLRRQLDGQRHIVLKSEIDLVTEMDTEVEMFFVKAIRQHFPDHEVLSEEMAGKGHFEQRPAKGGRIRWIIDPLDGTTNYAHGYPHFAVSAGIEIQGQVVMGAVVNPMLKEFFWAQQGRGAFRNDKKIAVSENNRLNRSLLATGFPYDLRQSPENNFDNFHALSQVCQAIRRAGAAALDLCDVACGRFDGFWELKLKPWDIAAGSLIVAEAGGRLSDFSGRPLNLYSGQVVASNGRIHSAMVRTLAAVARKNTPSGSRRTETIRQGGKG